MLVQQFYDNPKYAAFLAKNFVLYRATRGEKNGDAVYSRFNIRATPTELIVDADGQEIDWLVGYGPPPDKFLARLEKSLEGSETYRTLSRLQAEDPNDVAVTFKLARKVDSRYSMPEKAKELFQKVIALDPQGRAGTTELESLDGAKVTYTEYAEYALGANAAMDQKPDPAPMNAFIAKYPRSPLIKRAYQDLGYYYGSQAPKDQAVAFFEEYTAKRPDDPAGLGAYAQRIIRDKGDIDKGLALVKKIREIQGYNIEASYVQAEAELYLLKGDKAKADEVFGRDFLDERVGDFTFNLYQFAEFWAARNENLDSAEAAIEKVMKLAPNTWYYLRSAAGVYLKNGQEAKALAVYGPEYARTNGSDGSGLVSYARFWAGQGKNLESALAAGRRAVELNPSAPNFDVLTQLHMKQGNPAEALKTAERALVLAKEAAANNPSFPTRMYEDRLKQAREALAKDK